MHFVLEMYNINFSRPFLVAKNIMCVFGGLFSFVQVKGQIRKKITKDKVNTKVSYNMSIFVTSMASDTHIFWAGFEKVAQPARSVGFLFRGSCYRIFNNWFICELFLIDIFYNNRKPITMITLKRLN